MNSLKKKVKSNIKRFLPELIIRILRSIKNYKDRIFNRLFHIKITNEEQIIIRKCDLHGLKILHEKFKKPSARIGYNISDLNYRFGITCKILLSHNIVLNGKRLLDMGAGSGENLLFAGDYGVKEAVGIDYSAERYNNFIKANNDKLNEHNLSIISYVEEDVHKQVFEDNSFDIIISKNAFEHFENPKKVLFNIYKLCKQGGYVFINIEPLFNCPMGAHRYGYTGVPYIQNIFPNEIVFKFFNDWLKIDYTKNRYTKEKMTIENIYPEMNKWKVSDFEDIFIKNPDWEVIEFKKGYDNLYIWFIKMFPEIFKQFNEEDLLTKSLTVLLKKK